MEAAAPDASFPLGGLSWQNVHVQSGIREPATRISGESVTSCPGLIRPAVMPASVSVSVSSKRGGGVRPFVGSNPKSEIQTGSGLSPIGGSSMPASVNISAQISTQTSQTAEIPIFAETRN